MFVSSVKYNYRDNYYNLQPVIQPGENNQILINSGNAYQRVTVVPADANSGELSYVLIVQDPDGKDGEQTDGEQDMAG